MNHAKDFYMYKYNNADYAWTSVLRIWCWIFQMKFVLLVFYRIAHNKFIEVVESDNSKSSYDS